MVRTRRLLTPASVRPAPRTHRYAPRVRRTLRLPIPDGAPGVSLDQAIDLARTGDIWLFRGRSRSDRAIRALTNAPVNHVAMAVVLDDLPPLLWHAELGKGTLDVWAGKHQRGVQLHDMREAVLQWTRRYGQVAWFRQLTPDVTREQEDAVLRTVARWDGTPFPGSATLTARWMRGRAGAMAEPRENARYFRNQARKALHREEGPPQRPTAGMSPREAYCAEVVAVTYQAMGLLNPRLPSLYYDPGVFWSGDELALTPPSLLGDEIPVHIPAPPTTEPTTKGTQHVQDSADTRARRLKNRLPSLFSSPRKTQPD